MRWFGETWHAPCCSPKTHAKTPVGEDCLVCKKPIQKDDQGFLLWLVRLDDGDPKSVVGSEIPYHYDCFMRTILEGWPA